MRSALKEIEFLEKKYREDEELPVEAEKGVELPPIILPKFQDIQKRVRIEKKEKRETEKHNLEEKVENLEFQMKDIQDRLKQLSRAPDDQKENVSRNGSVTKHRSSVEEDAVDATPVSPPPPPPPVAADDEVDVDVDESNGAEGPHGDFAEFPQYDGLEPPNKPRKSFAQFCQKTRKDVKNSLGAKDRGNKEKVNGILRDRFTALLDEERKVWRDWAAWDKLRYARDISIYEKTQEEGVKSDQGDTETQIPKKRQAENSLAPVPKKKRR
jgi:hypothetical protein